MEAELRDELAVAAMIGLLMSGEKDNEAIAIRAYGMADAMLNVRRDKVLNDVR